MTGSRPAIALIIGLLVLCFGGGARAQDLSEGKTPQQLFRLNCSACHQSPAGLASTAEKAGGLFGLENFLAQHYTASGRSAQILADYLKSVGSAASQRRSHRPRRNASRPHKPAANKTDAAKKSDTARTSDKSDNKTKAGDAKADEPKADAAKMTDEKSEEVKSEKPTSGAGNEKGDKPRTTGNKATGDKKTN